MEPRSIRQTKDARITVRLHEKAEKACFKKYNYSLMILLVCTESSVLHAILNLIVNMSVRPERPSSPAGSHV